ncbi:MAG TPA: thiamine pyrophosphate-binding protein [Methanotrichaceae archaeon]|nr:thiamine pyrophosphate-binding protein [Methanotrichaceae archaeon]HQF17619.1 thiamine pyrophosphate-binding protein [Methanotrichaceae archaeon]HQI92207.1 thiamine pyrophosphate-binding protein [Methanotrichaceae archaeon]
MVALRNNIECSISDYLIERLYEEGVRYVFGIPGDYVLSFYNKLSKGPIQVVNTCDEQGAGFAADAYARINGLGAVCVTYGVGGLKLVNSIAQAYAEIVPVLVISGAPGKAERLKNPMLHHKAHRYEDQLKIFERITVSSAELTDPETAYSEIDRVLDTILQTKRPGYIEIPRDMALAVPANAMPKKITIAKAPCPDTPPEALDIAVSMINSAQKPVIVAGIEVERYGLVERVLALAWRSNIPIASSLFGKTAIPEDESLYMGTYAGALGREDVKDYVESSDCIIMIGVHLTDLNLGIYTSHLDPKRLIYIANGRLALVGNEYTLSVYDLLDRLASANLRRHDPSHIPYFQNVGRFYDNFSSDEKITVTRVFQALSGLLDGENMFLADPGDALFGSIEASFNCSFISPAYYASLGFAVPASIGAQLARPEIRPVVLTGDGSFQMTGMELAVAARYGLNPIVIVLNNMGYGTERPMIDGVFNDVAEWRYSKIPEVLGTGMGFLIKTEREFGEALTEAKSYDGPCILEVLLEKNDISVPLQRLCKNLSKSIGR